MERAERVGLGVAVAGHVLLFGVLSLGIASRPEMRLPSEPLSVVLTDEVALESASPNPSREAATAAAPDLGETVSTPAPAETAPPAPVERPVPQPLPKPARASPAPPAKPQPKPQPAERTEAAKPAKPKPAEKPRAPRVGSKLLEGVTDQSSTSRSTTPPAATAGPAVVASLQRELYRQVKPHWNPPTGADAELLRTKVTVRLDRDGTIIGSPSAVTSGVTPSNSAQERLHRERAIKAVQLAAPFDFPPQYYDEWQTIEPVFYLGL